MKYFSIKELAVTFYITFEFFYRSIIQRAQQYSGILLCSIGCALIVTGSMLFAESQTKPEQAIAQTPEGICCVARPEPVLFVLPPQQLAIVNPQAAQIDNTQLAAIPDAPPEPLEANYDDSLNRFAVGNLLWFIEGSFGALIMVGAGLSAIIAGAFGAYKAAISLLFVAVGAFILRALVSLFFGVNYDAYTEGGVGQFVGGGL
jgi:hypothetical protein